MVFFEYMELVIEKLSSDRRAPLERQGRRRCDMEVFAPSALAPLAPRSYRDSRHLPLSLAPQGNNSLKNLAEFKQGRRSIYLVCCQPVF
jgi:hypothetical protein